MTNIISGNANDNTINGTNHEDIIFGYAGNDTIYAKKGNDKVYGGTGNDLIDAGEGDDFVRSYGGDWSERDILTGGHGADTFSLVDDFGNPGYIKNDVNDYALIKDFNIGQGDKIQLDGYASHYQLVPVFWGESFGGTQQDTALMYIGSEQDKFELVGVLQDVTLNSAYLNIPTAFEFLG